METSRWYIRSQRTYIPEDRLPTHKIRPSKKNGTCSRVYGSYYHCPERSIGCHPLSFFIGFAGYRDAGVSPLKYLEHKGKDISGWGTEVRDKAEMQCLIVTTNRDDPNNPATTQSRWA